MTSYRITAPASTRENGPHDLPFEHAGVRFVHGIGYSDAPTSIEYYQRLVAARSTIGNGSTVDDWWLVEPSDPPPGWLDQPPGAGSFIAGLPTGAGSVPGVHDFGVRTIGDVE